MAMQENAIKQMQAGMYKAIMDVIVHGHGSIKMQEEDEK